MDVSAVLQAIMVARGWTQEELADELEAGQSSISRWLNGGSEPGGRTMERIRQLAIESRVVPRETEPSASNIAPLMGRVGAGAQIDVEYEQVPEGGYETVELPMAYSDPVVAFEIEGESQLPVYEPGEIIVCLRDQVRATDHYIGQRVVVRTTAGLRYLKRLTRGMARGTYNLESWNARTIEGVGIEWVGEIVGTVPPNAVKRMVRQQIRKAARKAAAKSVGSDT